MDFQMDFSLQRLAMISWSASFWNQTHVRDKINDAFIKTGQYTEYNRETAEKCIANLLKVAKNELQERNIPSKINDEFLFTILSSGMRIIHWYFYTDFELIGYTRTFYWTLFGTIDEAKIVGDRLEKLERLLDLWIIGRPILRRLGAGKLRRFNGPLGIPGSHFFDYLKRPGAGTLQCKTYYLACACIIKEYIHGHADEMFTFCKLYLREKREDRREKKKLNYILRSLFILATPEQLKISQETYNYRLRTYFPDSNSTKEGEMFLPSVKKGHVIAVRYYSQKLREIEKEDMLVPAAITCIEKIKKSGHAVPFRKIHHADILVFLLTQMSEGQRIEFFFHESIQNGSLIPKEFILDLILNSCSWEDFFIPVFSLVTEESRPDTLTMHYNALHLFNSIIDKLADMRKFGLDSKTTVYHQIFSYVSDEFKKNNTGGVMGNDEALLKKIYDLFDPYILSAVVAGHDESTRKEFFMQGISRYKQLMEENQLGVLDDFVEIVLESEDERTWFKNQLDFFEDFILEGKLNVIDKLLDWRSNSGEERMILKNGINALYICAIFFIKKCHNYAQKISAWRFSNDAEKMEFVNNLNGPELQRFLKTFVELIREDYAVIFSILEYLKWFFPNETERTKFMKEKIMREEVLRHFLIDFSRRPLETKSYIFGYLRMRETLEGIDELMEFCLPPEGIVELKKKILENIDQWQMALAGSNCWGGSGYLLKWALGYKTLNQKRRKIMLKKKKN